MIAYLRSLHHGGVTPLGRDVRTDDPAGSALLRAGRELSPQDEPAVVVVDAPVVEFQVAVLALDGDLGEIVVGVKDELVSDRQGRGHDVVRDHRVVGLAVKQQLVEAGLPSGVEIPEMLGVGLQMHSRAHGLMLENACLRVHYPRLAQQGRGHQFEVEAQLAGEGLRHGLVQVHGQHDVVPFRLDGNGVLEGEIGIQRGIEAGKMMGRVGITLDDPYLLGLGVNLARTTARQTLPLALGNLEADVAVGRAAVAVEHERDAALVTLGIIVAEDHHSGPGVLEILLLIETEILRPRPHAYGGQQDAGYNEQCFLHLNRD